MKPLPCIGKGFSIPIRHYKAFTKPLAFLLKNIWIGSKKTVRLSYFLISGVKPGGYKVKHHQWITYKVSEKWHGYPISDVLKGPLLLSNRMINRLTRSGGIRLNGKKAWLKWVLKEGDRLQVFLRPREKADLEPQAVPFSRVYEDQDFMVVDKPAGLKLYPTQPNEKTGTLLAFC